MNVFYFLLTILSVLKFGEGQSQVVPESPCQDVFQYIFENNRWIGVLRLRGVNINENIIIKAEFSYKGILKNVFTFMEFQIFS